MVERICWNCKFFAADDPETLLTGVCRRHAPRGVDYSSLNLPEQTDSRIDIGHCLAAGTMVGDALIPLHILGAGDALPATCHAANDTGMNANDILPLELPKPWRPVRVRVSASRLNTGAATVGANPILKIQPIIIGGDAQGAGETIEIVCDGADCQPHDTGTDKFVDFQYVFPLANLVNGGLVGFRATLDGTSEDEIAQVRNLKIGLLLGDNIGTAGSPSPIKSKAKWAVISLGNTDFCGEFEKAISTIPPIPEID
jgi:hypothetical protein